MLIETLESKLVIMQSHGLCSTCVSFIRLQFLYGLRISDLLRIRRSDILSNAVVVVYQSKGSEPLVCSLAYDWQFWLDYKAGNHSSISLFSYSFFYKLYKRYGLITYSEVGGNNSVTHSARKELARLLYAESGLIEVSQAALGHKSKSSTLYYLTKLQRNNVVRQGILAPPAGLVDRFIVKKRNGHDYIYLSR